MKDRYIMRFNGFDIMRNGYNEFYITLQTTMGAIDIGDNKTYESLEITQNRILELVEEMKIRFRDNITEKDKTNIIIEHIKKELNGNE
ncbi:hypothetical protein ES702_01428 [subsurface metagenome]